MVNSNTGFGKLKEVIVGRELELEKIKIISDHSSYGMLLLISNFDKYWYIMLGGPLGIYYLHKDLTWGEGVSFLSFEEAENDIVDSIFEGRELRISEYTAGYYDSFYSAQQALNDYSKILRQ